MCYCVISIPRSGLTECDQFNPFCWQISQLYDFHRTQSESCPEIHCLNFSGSADDFQVIEEAGSIFKKQNPFIAGGNVNSYFYNAFSKLWNAGIKDDFLKQKMLIQLLNYGFGFLIKLSLCRSFCFPGYGSLTWGCNGIPVCGGNHKAGIFASRKD